MSLIKEWIYRLRHNRGYGVQSPAAFYMVTHVLRESRHRYYCYSHLDSLAKKNKDYSAIHCRRLFRLANAIHPCNIIAVADKRRTVEYTLSSAVPSAQCTVIDNAGQMKTYLSKGGGIGLLHIGYPCDDYASILEQVLQHTTSHSVIIIEGIRRNNIILDWWNKIIAHPSVTVSMDWYNTGILFFNTEYRKQHYTFWFR